ncbi:hypothetical protein ACSZMI_09885 [Aeromonas veronii]
MIIIVFLLFLSIESFNLIALLESNTCDCRALRVKAKNKAVIIGAKNKQASHQRVFDLFEASI